MTMTTDITDLAQSLKAAAEKASGGDWVKESGDGWDATCSNDDQANSGFIIAHFVGPDSEANREFVQLANPANIFALVEALEKALKSNEFLKGQLSELANFNPDWDKLEASYESWREIAAELLVAKERIAEPESRTVKLPERYACELGYNAPDPNGDMLDRDDVIAALIAAGIKWEAE